MTEPVITGVGVVCPFGVGAGVFLDALAEGRETVRPIRAFDASAFATRVAGEVPDVLDAAAIERGLGGGAGGFVEELAAGGALRDRKVPLALLAAAEAWRHAGAGREERGAALCLGLGLEQAFLEDCAPLLAEGGLDDERSSGPGVRFRAPLDLAARAVRRWLGLRGPSFLHVSACAAGALAVAQAADLVARGAVEVVLCGGSDSMVNPLGIGGFSRLEAPSPRAAPDACRPFDADRDGLAIGEGAALFVVEARARAVARGARPLARVLGWGSSQDAYRATAPRPDGAAAARAIAAALTRAGLPPEAVGYVNAHGTGTRLNDPAEARAIRLAFGDHADRLPVSSIKGAIGHLMGAAGAVELAACLLPFQREVLPGTAHHRRLDPDCPLDVIGETPRRGRVDVALSNSFGFGGQNACVLLGRVA